MYYCENCRSYFTAPRCFRMPYPDHGGERYTACPHCGAPEMYTQIKGREGEDRDDD